MEAEGERARAGGAPAPFAVDPPVRFGFGSTPRTPSLVRVVTLVEPEPERAARGVVGATFTTPRALKVAFTTTRRGQSGRGDVARADGGGGS